jgi:hypothetical protein
MVVDILEDVLLLLVDVGELGILLDEFPSSGVPWAFPARSHASYAFR